MMKRTVAAVSLLLAPAAGATCANSATCKQQLDQRIEDVRERVVDRVQSETQSLLEVAPTAIMKADVRYEEGLIPLDLTTADNRQAAAESLYYQMKGLPELYWLYVGHSATGRFLGYRRPMASEIGTNSITANMLIRTECAGTGQPLQFFRTRADDSTGGDADGAAFASETYTLSARSWFVQGMAIARPSNTTRDENYQWTSVYTFTDGSLGLSAVRRVEDRANTATAIGVLGGDYTLQTLETFVEGLPVPNLPQSTSRGPVVIFEGSSQVLLGSNVNAPLSSGGNTILATNTNNTIVNLGVTELYSQHGSLLRSTSTSDWTNLRTNTKTISFTHNGVVYKGSAVGLEFPEGAASPLRWGILITTDADMGYTLDEVGCAAGTVGVQFCRDTLLTASLDLRERTLAHLVRSMNEYLGTAYVVVNGLDQAYNLGDFEATWCNTCGKIDIAGSATERSNVQNHLRNLLDIYTELYWIYVGQDSGRQYLGYLRPVPYGSYQLWECNGGSDSSTCGTAKFVWVSNSSVAATESVDPLTRPWYTIGFSLAYDKLAWTAPYVFGNGEAGFTIAKKSFDGDFSTTGGYGVWAADFSLAFVNAYISSLGVQTGWVLYIISDTGRLLGSNVGERPNIQASAANNVLITTTQAGVVAKVNRWSATNILTDQVVDAAGQGQFVDIMMVTDTSADVTEKYKWAIVLVVPENTLYNLDGLPLAGSSLTSGFVVAMIAVVTSTLCALV